MFQEYPERVNPNEEQELAEITDVCSCGHGDYSHERVKPSSRGLCRRCMCPMFVFETKMSIKQQVEFTINKRQNLREGEQ